MTLNFFQRFLVIATACLGGSCQKPALNTPETAQTTKSIRTSSGAEMVLVPAGSFSMGRSQGADTSPVHKVSVSAFYMDKYEVTQQAYELLMGVNISKFEAEKNPVEQVRWTQAAKYCNSRSFKEGLKPCYDETTWQCDFSANGYRLPTEAEWEYACRAGSQTAYSFGDDPEALRTCGWFKRNADKKTHPVGAKSPNAWGLHDMHGNVAEWCNDSYQAGYYKNSPASDPRGPEQGSTRVIRGGHWAASPEKCTSFYRMNDAPELPDICLGYDVYGFRCVRSATGAPVK
ncbi:MAG: formylglycine-generating enzyme family protein [Verrucomicrobia bacterium]|nr:formylglycine-generating enzyme family protein [Verrucomicrobiota bacterium]